MRIHTPHDRLNLAFEWAKIAYDNLLVDNPDLGTGTRCGPRTIRHGRDDRDSGGSSGATRSSIPSA